MEEFTEYYKKGSFFRFWGFPKDLNIEQLKNKHLFLLYLLILIIFKNHETSITFVFNFMTKMCVFFFSFRKVLIIG